MLPELVLYFRQGCHLCEDMEQLLEDLLEPGSFRLTRVDIDEHLSLKEAYNVRVPVLSLVRTPVTESTEMDSLLVEVQTVGALTDYPSGQSDCVV